MLSEVQGPELVSALECPEQNRLGTPRGCKCPDAGAGRLKERGSRREVGVGVGGDASVHRDRKTEEWLGG